MSKTNMILIALIFTITFLSFAATYYSTVIKGDFEIVDIDPPSEGEYYEE